MARKSKHMALNEAIRQGQAKIAEGLKTGQMRSDGPSAQKAAKDKRGLLGSENVIRTPDGKRRTFFLKSKEKSMISGQLSSKTKLVVLLCAASVVVLALGIWLFSLVGADQTPKSDPQGASVGGIAPEENEQGQKTFVLSGAGGSEPSGAVDSLSPEEEALLPPSKGDNVIWIQSIAMNRKSELRSLETFFRTKGIQTEIIEISESNLAVLVTRDSFEKNPSSLGTEGYKLLQRIKQLGPVYVEETGDTKFKLKPFQDAYGYKR